MYTIGFDENNKLIEANFTGTLSKEEPVEYVETLLAIKNLPENLKILQDFSNATYALDIDDLEGIAPHIIKYLNNFKSIKIAAVHNKTAETAFSMILSKLIEAQNLNYQVFSTNEAARNWLLDK